MMLPIYSPNPYPHNSYSPRRDYYSNVEEVDSIKRKLLIGGASSLVLLALGCIKKPIARIPASTTTTTIPPEQEKIGERVEGPEGPSGEGPGSGGGDKGGGSGGI